MEVAGEREVTLSRKDAENATWIIDYPVLCYLKHDRRKLVLVHLADPDAEEKVLELKADEEFIKFLD